MTLVLTVSLRAASPFPRPVCVFLQLLSNLSHTFTIYNILANLSDIIHTLPWLVKRRWEAEAVVVRKTSAYSALPPAKLTRLDAYNRERNAEIEHAMGALRKGKGTSDRGGSVRGRGALP